MFSHVDDAKIYSKSVEIAALVRDDKIVNAIDVLFNAVDKQFRRVVFHKAIVYCYEMGVSLSVINRLVGAVDQCQSDTGEKFHLAKEWVSSLSQQETLDKVVQNDLNLLGYKLLILESHIQQGCEKFCLPSIK